MTCFFTVSFVDHLLSPFHHHFYAKSFRHCLKSLNKLEKKKQRRPQRSTYQAVSFCDKAQSHVWWKLSANSNVTLNKICDQLAVPAPAIYTVEENCGKTHLMCAVGEVQASNVHSRLDHLLQHFHRTGGWPCRQLLKGLRHSITSKFLN